MTTLVTGAAGFVGSHVTRQLVARGDEVRVLLRASSTNRAIADLSLEYVTGDLREPASLDRAMKGVKRVFHVAADYRLWARSSQEIYDSNVGGTRNLLNAAKRAGRRTVSLYQHGGNRLPSTGRSIRMNSPSRKLEEMVGHYKRSKWMAEREALEAAKNGLPVIVAMPTTPVGPGDWKPTPTGKIILDFLNGKMPGYVETGLNFVGVEECAAGHLRVGEKGRVGERYLLGGENLTLKQMLDTLAKISGLDAPPVENSTWTGAGCSLCQYPRFSRLVGARAEHSGRGREDRPA